MAATRTKQNGDLDTQQAAREAARREGKTLGEWLHDAIADRAAELGVAENQIVGQERAAAVYARIERSRPSSARSQRRSAGDGRTLRDKQDDYEGRSSRSRMEPEDDYEDDYDRRTGRDRRVTRRAGDTLTSFADLLERNEMRRSQERDAVSALTDKLASLESKLAARYESSEHPVKGALARLEARLDAIGRREAAETMVRANTAGAARAVLPAGSVSRLEEKLDSILQAVHVQPATVQPATVGQTHMQPVRAEPFHAQPRQAGAPQFASETSTAALLDAQRYPQEPARKRLGDAIADIARRQRALDHRPSSAADHESALEARSPDVGPWPSEAVAPAGPPATPDMDMATLAAKVDALRFDVMVGRGGWSEGRDTALASVRDELESLSQRQSDSERRMQELRSAAERQTGQHSKGEPDDAPGETSIRPDAEVSQATPERVANMQTADALPRTVNATTMPEYEGSRPGLATATTGLEVELAALRKLETRLDTLSSKVDNALSERPPTANGQAPDGSVAAVEALLRELGEKIEQVGAPKADEQSLEELQQHVERLSSRFAKSEQDLATLPTLAGSVTDLFQQLEATRADVEDRASRAARDALGRLLDERAAAEPAGDGDASLRAMQVEADLRTRSTLSTVHDMLEKVVGRLSQMEEAIAELRAARADAHRSAPVLGAVEARDPSIDRPTIADLSSLDLAFGGPNSGRAQAMPATRMEELSSRTVDRLGETAQQADFIAAARRAAQSAQAESVATVGAQAAEESGSEQDLRAGLLAKSRAFVASHRRPVLVGVAAVLMVLGAIAVLQRASLMNGPDIAKGEGKVATKVARAESGKLPAQIAAPAATPVKAGASLGKATPEAPAATDPMQTASITKLPSFAAQAALGPSVTQQALPVGLMAAAEAGDAAAQYHLAARYADGRSVPRDPKMAARLFEKAAASGSAPARYRLASMYEKGVGVPEDKARAKALYLQAAEAGNPRAMHNLGVLLADGGGRPDYSGAAAWFEKAANLGVRDSQFNLAILLARGLGMQQSLIQSYKWFAIAAANHDSDAAQKRDEVGAKLTADDQATAKALAAAFRVEPVNADAVDVPTPAGGWDSLSTPSHLNSPKSKVSSL